MIRRRVTLFLGCLVLSIGLATVFGQSGKRPNRKVPVEEPMEKYDQPPAPPPLLQRRGVSPRMISTTNLFTSYQVNVNGSNQNITGDAANEPSICVDPSNRQKMSIGWRQFNSVSSNFRQAGWGYTSNGGTSWTFPGILENNVFRSDPVLYADETGRFYYLSLLQSFFDDIWRSLNGGQTYTRLAPATGGDKQWFTIDTTNSSGHGFHYQIWSTAGNNYGGRQFTRSTDGGATWLNPIFIPNTPVWGTLDVDSNGTLFIGGVNLNTDQFWCIRSSNAKNGAVTPTFDLSTPVNMGGLIDFSDTINPEGLAGQLFLAVDRSGSATNNNIYMMATVQPTGFTTGTDIMFVRSTNSGASFSAPIRINDDPINHSKWHWMGTISVAPNGRIDCVWLDTRNAANNTDSQLYYSYSVNGGVTWKPNIQVSNSFNPFIGYPQQNKMGDYMTMISDNTGGNVAYAATFNGEEDVYFVRVAPSFPTAQSAVSRKNHIGVGDFDVPLPVTGGVGIESRSGPNYQMIINFATPVTVQNATIAAGTANVQNFSVNGSQVTVNLTGVTNAQRVTVTLGSVNNGQDIGDVAVSMDVLIGDSNANGVVNATDISQVKGQIGLPVDGTNFRTDVNTSGAVNSTDAAIAKGNSGTSLPP